MNSSIYQKHLFQIRGNAVFSLSAYYCSLLSVFSTFSSEKPVAYPGVPSLFRVLFTSSQHSKIIPVHIVKCECALSKACRPSVDNFPITLGPKCCTITRLKIRCTSIRPMAHLRLPACVEKLCPGLVICQPIHPRNRRVNRRSGLWQVVARTIANKFHVRLKLGLSLPTIKKVRRISSNVAVNKFSADLA